MAFKTKKKKQKKTGPLLSHTHTHTHTHAHTHTKQLPWFLLCNNWIIVASSSKDSQDSVALDNQHISVAKCKHYARKKKVRLTSCPLMPDKPGCPFSPGSP